MNTVNLNNKKVLITGGTSGLGKALVSQLHELGAKIAIVARREEELAKIQKTYSNVITIKGDVAAIDDIYPIAAGIQNQLGDVNIIIHCASYLGTTPLRPLLDTPCEDLLKVLMTNLLGPFRLTKALIAPMILKEQGIIVNVSSDAAINAYPNWGAYSISKAALDHMSRIFYEELKDLNLRFLSVDPGDMNTPMHFDAIPDADPSQLKDPQTAARQLIELIQNNSDQVVRHTLT